MGRGAARMLQIAILLVNPTNRKEFYRDGNLIAFPSLGYLATYGNMSKKTAQRGIGDLEEAGLLKTTHRFNGSNLYHLTTPAEAEQNYFEQEEMDRKSRKRRRQGVQTDGLGAM
jgi:DNA-binding GntR family transcriptional regulator